MENASASYLFKFVACWIFVLFLQVHPHVGFVGPLRDRFRGNFGRRGLRRRWHSLFLSWLSYPDFLSFSSTQSYLGVFARGKSDSAIFVRGQFLDLFVLKAVSKVKEMWFLCTASSDHLFCSRNTTARKGKIIHFCNLCHMASFLQICASFSQGMKGKISRRQKTRLVFGVVELSLHKNDVQAHFDWSKVTLRERKNLVLHLLPAAVNPIVRKHESTNAKMFMVLLLKLLKMNVLQSRPNFPSLRNNSDFLLGRAQEKRWFWCVSSFA